MQSLRWGLAVLACPVGMGLMTWMMMRSQPGLPSVGWVLAGAALTSTVTTGDDHQDGDATTVRRRSCGAQSRPTGGQLACHRDGDVAARAGNKARAPATDLPALDVLFIDEPAPGLDELAIDLGRPVVIIFGADDCVVPQISGAQLVRCAEPALAARYAMTTSTGRVGPGYAVVDAAGQLRYLTHDFAPGDRGERIQRLVNALGEPE